MVDFLKKHEQNIELTLCLLGMVGIALGEIFKIPELITVSAGVTIVTGILYTSRQFQEEMKK